MTNPVHVVSTLTARPGHEEALRSVLIELLAPTRAEAGCVRYELLESREQKGRFVFVEEWSCAADLDAHLATPHIARAVEKLAPHTATGPEIVRYDLVG